MTKTSGYELPNFQMVKVSWEGIIIKEVRGNSMGCWAHQYSSSS